MKSENFRKMVEKLEQRIWLYWSSITNLLSDDLLDQDAVDEVFDDLISLVRKIKNLGGVKK
jgi:hypothetical protein